MTGLRAEAVRAMALSEPAEVDGSALLALLTRLDRHELDMAHTEALLDDGEIARLIAAHRARQAEERAVEAEAALELYRSHVARLSEWMGDRDGEVWRSTHDLSERVIARTEQAERERDEARAEAEAQREEARKAREGAGPLCDIFSPMIDADWCHHCGHDRDCHEVQRG